MFFVVGITWIAEVISFLLNYGFGYNNVIAGDGPSSGHTNAIIIKASFLFDCVNAFQGIIMFCAVFLFSTQKRRIFVCLDNSNDDEENDINIQMCRTSSRS